MEFEILKRAASVFGVTDAVLVDGEDGFTFRQAGPRPFRKYSLKNINTV
jgi:hypothetical protein